MIKRESLSRLIRRTPIPVAVAIVVMTATLAVLMNSSTSHNPANSVHKPAAGESASAASGAGASEHSSAPQLDDPLSDVASPPSPAIAQQPDVFDSQPAEDHYTRSLNRWRAMLPALNQADQETATALDTQINAFTAFLEGRKAGCRPFAEAILGAEGKLCYTGGLLEQAGNAVNELFQADVKRMPDRFRDFVRNCYGRHLIDPERLAQEIHSRIAAFEAEVRRIDGQLLVRLRADLGDEQLVLDEARNTVLSPEHLSVWCDAALGDAITTASEDFVAMIAKGAMSWVVGDAIGGQLTGPSDSLAQKLAVNAFANYATDQAIDAAVERAGYDPVHKAAKDAAESINMLGLRVILGDTTVSSDFPMMYCLSMAHPDQAVRDACRRAFEASDGCQLVGLLPRLRVMQFQHMRRRGVAIFKHVFGPKAEIPPGLTMLPFSAEQLPPPKAFIDQANSIIDTIRRRAR